MYFVEYKGKSECRLQGHPTISVHDQTGKLRPSYAQYDENIFTTTTGEHPVTLSAKDKTAWFLVHTAYACDDKQGDRLSVKVALPGSHAWIRTLEFPNANCPVSVTPIRPISTLQRP